MALSVSRIQQNEPAPVPVSNPAFRGKNIPKVPRDGHKLSNAMTVAGLITMLALPILGWISGCNHIVKDKAANKTEVPVNVQDTTAVHFDVDV